MKPNNMGGMMRLFFLSSTCMFLARVIMPVALVVVASASASSADVIEIRVQLDDRGAYSVDDFLEQCNEKLALKYNTEQFRGQRRVLSPAERTVLLLANETGLIEVTITEDYFILKLPNPKDNNARNRIRSQIRQWLRIPTGYWAEKYGLHITEKLQTNKATLLLVHGLEGGPGDFQRFAQACKESHIQVISFSYPNDGSLTVAGEHLSIELKQFALNHPKLRVAIVGHSMGGLVARYCLEMPNKNPGCVSDLFMLGTPNHGSALAVEQTLVELVFQIAPKGFRGLQSAMCDGLGESADDLQPGSLFLRKLNARSRANGIQYHAGIGRRSFIAKDEHKKLLDDIKRILRQRGVTEGSGQELLKIMSSEELKDGYGDGAVTIESARLKGVVHEQIFELNHIELFSLPGESPKDCKVFQWILQTMDWDKYTGKQLP